MNIFNGLEPAHLIILIVVIAIVFGWKKLPDASRSLGRSMRIFKSEVNQMKKESESTSSATTAQPGQAAQSEATTLPSGSAAQSSNSASSTAQQSSSAHNVTPASPNQDVIKEFHPHK